MTRRANSGAGRLSWSKISGHANINHLKTFSWSDSIELIRQLYEKTPFKFRDPRIGEALFDIESAPPSCQHLVEFMITLYRAGFWGPEVSQDLLCDHISRCTHAHRFGVRTLRNAARWAMDQGLITAEWIPIGKRCTTDSGEWRTKRIRRYTATYKLRLLVSVFRDRNHDPHLESVTNATQVRDEPTSEKRSDNPNGEQPQGNSKNSPCGMLLRHNNVNDNVTEPRNERHPDNEELPASTAGNMSTQPKGGSLSTLKHRTSTNGSKSRQPIKTARRRTRGKTTYQAARRSFLHELFIALKPGSQYSELRAQELYNIAELQTDPYYLSHFPTALDWDELLMPMYFDNWHGRRKTIDKIILPALRRYAAEWAAPAADLATAQGRKQFSFWEMNLIPEPGLSICCHDPINYYRQWSFVRPILSMIHAGRMQYTPELLQNNPLIVKFSNFIS